MISFYPLLMTFFMSARLVAKSDGTYPGWLMAIQVGVFRVMWTMHDWVLKPFVGDGETAFDGEGGDESGSKKID